MQAADLKSDVPILNTERASLEGRSADPASSSMISVSNLDTPWSPGSPIVIQGVKGAPQHGEKEGRLVEQMPDEHRLVVHKQLSFDEIGDRTLNTAIFSQGPAATAKHVSTPSSLVVGT